MKALSYVPLFNFIVEKRNGQKETKTMLSVVKTGIRPSFREHKKYHPFAQWCWQVLYLLGFLDMTSLYLMIFGVLMPLMIRYSIFSSRS